MQVQKELMFSKHVKLSKKKLFRLARVSDDIFKTFVSTIYG